MTLALINCAPQANPPVDRMQAAKHTEAQVEVGLHMMSACPFSAEVLSPLLEAVDSFEGEVTVRPRFIGRTEADVLGSIYGPSGVRGDLLQVCALDEGGRDLWQMLSLCHAEQGDVFAPDTCLGELGAAGKAVAECADSRRGFELLKQSYDHSARAERRASPTLVIDGTLYTGGRTRAHLMEALCELPRLRPTKACHSRKRPPAVEVVVYRSPSCTESDCDEGHLRDALAYIFPRLSLRPEALPPSLEGERPHGIPADTKLAAFIKDEHARPYTKALARVPNLFSPTHDGSGLVAIIAPRAASTRKAP